jgi:hypothetical protein
MNICCVKDVELHLLKCSGWKHTWDEYKAIANATPNVEWLQSLSAQV